jgi:DNA-directed RNA polymerase specialized sigma24 family protein
MVESFLEELPQDDEATAADVIVSDVVSSEQSLLSVLPIIRRIVRRRYSSPNASDLIQEVALRLWRWQGRYQNKSEKMSPTEWNAFAAQAAYNELNRRPANGGKHITDESIEIAEFSEPSVEGQTEAEVFSLIRQAWQQICELSLRQRRALLLHSHELIVYFMQSGIRDRELAATLELSDSEWNDIRNRLPLSDLQIAEIILEAGHRRKINSAVRSIKKARYEARKKLEDCRKNERIRAPKFESDNRVLLGKPRQR